MSASNRSALCLAAALLLAACEAREIAGPATDRCLRCHGGMAGNAAPPRSLHGATERTDPGVGAHQAHLAGGAVAGPMACAACHVVPAASAPGAAPHLNGRRDVTFDGAPRPGGAFDAAAGTCSGAWCHGAGLSGASARPLPVWTAVDGAAAACGACHGNPPAAPHPQLATCSGCHDATMATDTTIDLASGTHVDGAIQAAGFHPPGWEAPAAHGLAANRDLAGCRACHGADLLGGLSGVSCSSCHPGWESRCDFCHGDRDRPGAALARAAPPQGTQDELATAARAVGAHARHLEGGPLSAGFACAECHPVPADIAHVDGQRALDFGPIADAEGSSSFDGATCTTYCHGATLGGGALTTPAWTTVDGSQAACGACHGNPPPAPHFQLSGCRLCHPATVRDDGTIDAAGGRHVNGAVEVDLAAGCDGCHGAPPASGAHAVHATPPSLASVAYGALTILEDVAPGATDAAQYAFGCGHCHPLDGARHLDGATEVDLSPAGAPAGSLKARNLAAAAYDGGTGTCAGVACHASGQASPPAGAFRTTPAWTSGTSPGCGGCHGNPPRYPSGGPGAVDANSHLQLQADGYEWGHFGGLPGPWHTAWHGVEPGTRDGAPITCQACHAGTVDPAATYPGGFFWLDTTGDYDLGGALGYSCTGCHTGEAGAPAQGQGRVRRLLHVNGRPDVAFDGRAVLPALPWLPAAPNTPTRPYWVRPGNVTLPVPFDGGMDGATLSLHLGGAAFDPATKTCSSVACHLFETEVTWGLPHEGWPACARCHGF